jgi:hypothetical protein
MKDKVIDFLKKKQEKEIQADQEFYDFEDWEAGVDFTIEELQIEIDTIIDHQNEMAMAIVDLFADVKELQNTVRAQMAMIAELLTKEK